MAPSLVDANVAQHCAVTMGIGMRGCAVDDAADKAIWRLAERLYHAMKKLDPSPDIDEWEDMNEFDRRFYYVCVMSILEARDDVTKALV
jgi:hypothetical protein